MKSTHIAGLTLLVLVILGSVASAHHGTSAYYDKNKYVKLEGVVHRFDWRNPHCGLFVLAKDATGQEGTYALEMGSPSSMARLGLTRDSVKPGDKVVVTFHPAFTNPLAGELNSRDLIVNGKLLATLE